MSEMESLSSVLREIRLGLDRIYGPRLHGVYLFGSRACGRAEKESDVDLLVVLDEVTDYGAEIARTSHLIADQALRCGLSLSRVFVSNEAWESRRTPFLDNVREEAVPA